MHRYIAPPSAYCVDDRFHSDSTCAEDSEKLARIPDNNSGSEGCRDNVGAAIIRGYGGFPR